MSWGCGNPYGWCRHRAERGLTEWQQCLECAEKNRKTREEIIKRHAKSDPNCTSYSCDHDYWDNLGRQ